ncbi:hypothetical protein HRbin21_01307 [bacterium HR21]|nr:hypothetical protein HRbin21_01307 [bacterium HR21]
MMRAVLSIGVSLLLGCATPSGTYRDYFGFNAASREQPRSKETPTAQSEPQTESRHASRESPVGVWETPSVVVVSPAWVYPDWYAPWCPYPVFSAPWWEYRWWYARRYRSWCSPWYRPPVIVVVPVEQEPVPPVRVRTFGPARGNPEHVAGQTVQGESGGGRARGRVSSGSAASDKPAELRRGERQGGRDSAHVNEGGGRQRREGAATEDASGEGGGRSRGTKP